MSGCSRIWCKQNSKKSPPISWDTVPSLPRCNLIGYNLCYIPSFLWCDAPPQAVSPWYPSTPVISSSSMSGWSRKQALSVLSHWFLPFSFWVYRIAVSSFNCQGAPVKQAGTTMYSQVNKWHMCHSGKYCRGANTVKNPFYNEVFNC